MAAGPLRLIPATPGHRALAVRIDDLLFKKAETPDEIRQVHELNYQTFVREIGQHPDPGRPILVDKYHEKNLYLVAKRDEAVVAMVAVHDTPPFSVAARIPESDWIEHHCPRPLEVRLLAVRPEERGTVVLAGLLWSVYRLALAAGYSHLLASGVRQQVQMYRRIGFEPLGPEMQCGSAWFTALALPVRRMPLAMRKIAARMERLAGLEPLAARPGRVSLLPGPPEYSPEVRRALQAPPISHRDARFARRFEEARQIICEMTGAKDVAMSAGSGTLANECIAAALAHLSPRGRGLILANGEFGSRLIDQAHRWQLDFETLAWPWGQPWRMTEVADALARLSPGDWVWGVHCETSTGVLNPIAELIDLAGRRRVRVCLDCVSSLGSVPLDLRGVFLASGVSGKCLGAPAGIAILMGDAEALRASLDGPLPLYLDPLAGFGASGPRFTLASNLLSSLHAALRRFDTPLKRERVYGEIRELSAVVRGGLRRLSAAPLADDANSSPAVTTFAPPMGYSPEHFALLCRAYGFEVNSKSPYLPARGLVQIATMGAVSPADCRRLFSALEQWGRSAG